MTILDYHDATGLSRRTALNIVRRLNAKPIAPRQRRNEAAKYGSDANIAVLCEWLMRYVKNISNRKALLVGTLLHCKHDSPNRFQALLKKVSPVISSLEIGPEEFVRYFFDCEKILHPPPPKLPASPFDLLLGGISRVSG